jgi:hypothetical protein
MNENSPTNQSAIELRLKQVIRYVSLALCGILALCLLLFMYIGSVKQSEQTAVDQSQAQAQTAVRSDLCQVYPATDVCEMSREILSNPEATIVPKDGTNGNDGTNGKDGKDGKDGADGRGVTSFDQSTGDLIVTYTDGQTKNLGRVVGKDGAQGIQGLTGRGILSTALRNGNLIVNYTDGTSETLGYIVGPAGENGAAGKDGAAGTNGVDGQPGRDGVDGAPGRDGISVTGVTLDNTNTVWVSYSNGQTLSAGQLVINTIKFMQCKDDTLTIGMVDGTAFTTTVDCTPDNLPATITPTKLP